MQHSGSLKIPHVAMQDAGVYECIAENRAGSPVRKEVTLEVIGEWFLSLLVSSPFAFLEVVMSAQNLLHPP